MAYTVTNPLNATDLQSVIKLISQGIIDIAIPIAVALYIWAGVLYLTAGANPANVGRAKKVFYYTTIGLVVIFIGGGFIDLIKSILNAGQ